MAAPVYSTGDVPTADEVNDFMVNNWFARKTADESVVSSTTFQDDDHLTVNVDANAVYVVLMNLVWDANTVGDIKWDLEGPASATFFGTMVGLTSGAAANTDDHTVHLTLATTQVQGGIGSGTSLGTSVVGLLITSGTAGTLKLQWAQNASSATATRIFTGSFLSLYRVA